MPYQNFPLFVKNLISLEDIFAKEFLANLFFASNCVNKFFCSPISEPKNAPYINENGRVLTSSSSPSQKSGPEFYLVK